MLVNILLGTLIFGYAGWALYRYVQKTKQGKCAGCAVKNSCSTAQCTPSLPSSKEHHPESEKFRL